jgi:hypothetical protein
MEALNMSYTPCCLPALMLDPGWTAYVHAPVCWVLIAPVFVFVFVCVCVCVRV